MQSELILIVDDEAMIRVSLRATLSNIGFKTLEAGRGEEALALVRTNRVDAVLLDINMPGMNGIDVCKNIRSLRPRLAILMLTVRDGEDDIVTALDSGADDYITKPFHLRELTARMRAAIRGSLPPDEVQVLQVGQIELDPVRRTVKKGLQQVHLTPKEFELTQYLMSCAGRPVSHSRLLSTVWGPGYSDQVEYLRTFIRQLRMKLEDDPSNPRYLLTDSRVGYRFVQTA
jgi:two-component system KDP operon response regulator KdpE